MFDYDYILKDSGLVAASVEGKVDAVAKVVDVGAGLVEGHMVIDVSVIQIDGDSESYDIQLQGLAATPFTSGSNFSVLASLKLGAKEKLFLHKF